MKKLLHISPNTYPKLQVDHFTKQIWIELAEGFDEYHVIARGDGWRYSHSVEGKLHLHLVPGILKRSRLFFFTSLIMLYLIPRYRISHLLAQCAIMGGFWARIYSQLFLIPLMVEVHGDEYFRYCKSEGLLNTFLSSIFKWVLHGASTVRSLSPSMSKKLAQIGVSENVTVIPGRVDMSIFSPPKQDYYIDEVVSFISVGRFVWEKNYLNLIKLLEKSGVNFKLTLIGGGPLRPEYETYIKSRSLGEKVCLIDWVDQPELIKQITLSDVYIQYSVSEGMPRTIIESMGLKMPIISTNVGSIDGILKDGQNCLLLDSFDELENIALIKKIVLDEDFRTKISEQAYQDVLNNYEWDKVFVIYRNALLAM